jgi:hypothetical protein
MKLLLMFLLMFLLACGTSPATAPGPALTAAQLRGPWTFTLASMAGRCSGAAGGGDLHLTLSGDANGDLMQFGDVPWDYGIVTGEIRLSTGAVDLRLWKQVAVSGAQLTGTIDPSTLRFTGQLMDPQPGMQPIFVLGQCLFPVTGGHDE